MPGTGNAKPPAGMPNPSRECRTPRGWHQVSVLQGGRVWDWGNAVFVPPPACSSQQIRQTCVRKSLICAFAIAFIISVMLIAANQVLRSGMK